MAPNGFVQRWQGKAKIGSLWLGRGGITQHPEVFTAVPSSPIRNSGVAILSASSGALVYTLADPVQGVEKTIALSTVSSGVFIKSTNSATFDGTNPVMKSTQAFSITLMGLSTSRWQITGIGVPNSSAALPLAFTATT